MMIEYRKFSLKIQRRFVLNTSINGMLHMLSKQEAQQRPVPQGASQSVPQYAILHPLALESDDEKLPKKPYSE